MGAKPVERTGDTLTYYVEMFKDTRDRSIGDVLKKLPGIQVNSSGSISYNGKEINKFYVEGLDMLGGRYGIATNNIQASDISSVEVYENHEPVKMLQEWSTSDKAAINLRLKKGARGAWNGIFLLGGGYKPWQWNAEASLMYFGRKFQTISTYKSNNSGVDVSKELIPHYDGLDEVSPMLFVTSNSLPSMSEERYLNNNIHSASFNFIKKFDSDSDMTFDVSYVHNETETSGYSETTYWLNDGLSVFIKENVDYSDQTDLLSSNLQFHKNADRTYLKNRLSFEVESSPAYSTVSENEDSMQQELGFKSLKARNSFTMRKRWDRWYGYISSETAFNALPTTLEISPTPYPSTFGFVDEDIDITQHARKYVLKSNNSVRVNHAGRIWNLSLLGNANVETGRMTSYISAGEGKTPDADSLRNHLNWYRVDIGLTPNIQYTKPHGRTLSIVLTFPMTAVIFRTKNDILSSDYCSSMMIVSPIISAIGSISSNLRYMMSANWMESLESLGNNYSGYVMTSYRNIGNRDVPVDKITITSVSGSLSYSGAMHSLFLSLNASYTNRTSEYTYGTEYLGTLSRSVAYKMENESEIFRLSCNTSKRFNDISTTVNVSAGWNRSWNDYLRQSELVSFVYDRINIGLGINSRIGKVVIFSYDGNFYNNESCLEGLSVSSVNALNQKIKLSFLLGNKLSFTAGGEHNYNSSVDGENRNSCFVDAELSYKSGRIEYILEGKNLLNDSVFSSSYYSDGASYFHSTSLRPFSVLLKIRFSIR